MARVKIVLTRLTIPNGRLYGMCDIKNKIIYINVAQDHVPLAKIFLHELIHWENPLLPETTVRRMESYLWSRLTPRKKFALYKELMRRAVFQ